MKIGFLFNHYAAHQVLHAAPIAFELSRRCPAAEVTVVTVGAEIDAVVRRLAERYPGQRCALVRAAVPRLVEWIDPLVRQVKFLRKDAVLAANLQLFAAQDVLVVPERSSLKLKSYKECRHLRFVHTKHGAGDRAQGFSEELRGFDLLLLPGAKYRDRLLREGVVEADRCRVVGYPKFELMGALSDGCPAFAERRPTVLYNPHFEQGLSSWRAMGREVLEFFRSSRDYNLIFAPHVVLYQRGLRHGARPLGRYRNRPNMLMDTGSLASIDMTYTLAADIYLGDVSSQIYEFLWHPRPCIFLDAERVDGWADDPNYRFWHTGQVLRDVADLPEALARAGGLQDGYREVQHRLFAETFESGAVAASIRAADAVAEFYGLTVAATDGGRLREAV